MKIVDVWKQNNDIFAYCTGEGIDAKFSCKEISVNGTKCEVDGFDILTSISGAVGAVLKIAGNIDTNLLHGTFKIVK